ncbi:MAG: hypothetical protein DHS20C12_05860 [Pseudohongiella sp.]|nr:MAG: hypothetical protein DHS20C12_05860 [Pseudohongiella sp.]
MYISQNFDAGNIEVVSCSDPSDIQLNIRSDNASEFYQWFYYRLSGVKGRACTMHILNAGGAAYPPGFENYRVCYSYDRQNWLRHPTTLNDSRLTIEFRSDYDSVYFAYFAPYSMERHADLIARSQLSPLCSHQIVGKTLDGQDIDLLKISSNASEGPKRNCWIIARQHPGESMAEWWMEGCIERLIDEGDSASKKLLSQCDVYLVPNMNPDGSRRGHLRTNAAGRNLNREWEEPEIEASPEVYFVKRLMDEVGVDFMLDVHGDESLPYCFIAGTEGLIDWDIRKQEQLDFYRNKLAVLNPDFQTEKGYPAKSPGTANLTMSTVQTAQNHGCLAMTLEMPFKDTTATSDATYGWSGERSKKLAHSCLDALSSYLQRL